MLRKTEASCWGRYIIYSPRDDTKVNAKVYLKGDRLVVMATTDIIYEVDYGADHWMDK